ncbi:MAG TPA: DUF2382 domain-containing protein [Longimicrobiales bacterium]
MANEMDRIVSLDDLEDFEVAEGEPDVRGWEVLSADGERIGEVDQLLVDTTAMKVRYLDVDLENDLIGTDEDRHTLIPIGFARLDEDNDQIFVDNLRTSDVQRLPAWGHGPVTRDVEVEVRRAFEPGFAPEREERFYEHEHFAGPRRGMREGRGEEHIYRSEEELAVGKREVSAGEVEIDKEVETEHVRRPIRLRHDEVEIERHPVSDGEHGREARFQEEEIHIPMSEEEAVVEKRPVAQEELVVRKRPVEETEEVEADIRRERLDVEKHGRIEREEEEEEERRRRGL